MSQQTHSDAPVPLAKRILRNENFEMVLPDSLASLMFPEDVKGWREGEKKGPQEKIPSFRKLYWLAMCLKKVKQFEYARKVLGRALSEARATDHVPQKAIIKIIQQRALCTYKDTYLPADERLNSALSILDKELKPIQPAPDQETLGLRGAIYKRKWEMDGTKQHLEMSLAYYQQGYAKGITDDYGYTSVNAAFILDLIANVELEGAVKSGTGGETAVNRMAEAKKIRGEIKDTLQHMLAHKASLGNEWWFLTTLAEACFGREEYTEAAAWLARAGVLRENQKGVPVCSNKVPEWEMESTARQLASLARVQEHNARLAAKLGAGAQPAPATTIDEEALPAAPARPVKETEAWKVLREFLGNEAGVETAYAGKVGLALSGGGFRASLFHIGVLARLAELDVLRHVEVLSCVSGGSIVGAYYYLEVRKLLKDTPDLKIEREHYVQIVQRIEQKFLEGVKTNIRTSIASNLFVNLKMFFNSSYTPTSRAGELYEQNLYSMIEDGEGGKPRPMQGLTIRPHSEPESFTPKFNNWRRKAKAPILILNATTLNTGHNWHFTATYMGESPANIIPEIDGNCRLRRMYYADEAPDKHKDITLGSAVAASACVPALFDPLVLKDLYEQNMTVRLVDGGVHDNQGIAGLLEQDCTVLLVSDASGQMKTEEEPSGNPIGVSLRSNSVLMARVREAEYRELLARRRSSLLSGLMYIHLRKDLQVDPVDWCNCKDTYKDSDEYKEAQQNNSPWTTYGIMKRVQERLALIRTDLDSFSEVEAYSLMLSGYYMTGIQFRSTITSVPVTEGREEKWLFKEMDALVRENASEGARAEFLHMLEVGQKRGFKLWYLSPTLRLTGKLLKGVGSIVLLAALVMLPVSLYFGWFSPSAARWAGIILGVLIIPPVLALLLDRFKLKRTRWLEGKLIRAVVGLVVAPLMWVAAGIHLLLFDGPFLKRGSLARMQRLQGKTPRQEPN